MANVKVYFKKKLQLSHLNISQSQMYKVGVVGVAQVLDRTAQSLNENDQKAKPLTKAYAIRKTKMGRGNRRNLRFTGAMLREFRVRTVSNKSVAATNTSRLGRAKSNANNRIERWVAFSPRNRAAIDRAGRQIILERSIGRYVSGLS
jgi:hypothetical protein